LVDHQGDEVMLLRATCDKESVLRSGGYPALSQRLPTASLAAGVPEAEVTDHAFMHHRLLHEYARSLGNGSIPLTMDPADPQLQVEALDESRTGRGTRKVALCQTLDTPG